MTKNGREWSKMVKMVKNGKKCDVPTNPKSCPGFGVDSLCNLKEFPPYLCAVSDSKLAGKLIIEIASKGHFLVQILQPIRKVSEILAILPTPFTLSNHWTGFLTILITFFGFREDRGGGLLKK